MAKEQQQPNRYSIMNGLIWDSKKQFPNVGRYLPGATALLNQQDREITELRAALEALTQAAEAQREVAYCPVEQGSEGHYMCGLCSTVWDQPHTPGCPYLIAGINVSTQIAAARALLSADLKPT